MKPGANKTQLKDRLEVSTQFPMRYLRPHELKQLRFVDDLPDPAPDTGSKAYSSCTAGDDGTQSG